MTNLRNRRRRSSSTSYLLTTALVCSALIAQVKPSFGGAGSVLDSTDPLKAAPPLQTRVLGVGDMTVASRTGAFEYSFPIALPPGRVGSSPSLSLSYSSQGALRGNLAMGWSLGLPEIHLEIPDGKGREEGGVFVSSLSGGNRLVRTLETPLKGFDSAYRSEVDDSFTRYSMNADPGERSIIAARTSDGSYYEFWNFRAVDHEYSTRWPLHIAIDKYGNKTEYEYEYKTQPLDGETNVLVAITYGANENAGLEDFARIEFRYDESDSPCPGTTLVTGASLSHRGYFTEIHGSKKLDGIDVLAKPAPGAGYLHTRSYELNYDTDAAACDENHGPLRVLTGIQEHAPKLAGDLGIGSLHADPTQWISKPPVSFGYGPLERSWDHTGETGLSVLGRGGRVDSTSNIGRVGSSQRPSLKEMLIDFNGDGYIDKLSAVVVDSETTTCEMQIRLGDGGSTALKTSTVGEIVPLPTLPWKLGANPWLVHEGCSLSGQNTLFQTREGYEHCSNLGAYNSFRFMDMDSDGLPDLVTEIWADPLWYSSWDQGSGVDTTDLPPFTGNDTGACPLLPRENFLAAEVCPGDRETGYCYFDQAMIQADIEQANESGDSVPCGVLYRQINPNPLAGPHDLLSDGLRPVMPTPPPSDDDEPDHCPVTNDRAPEVINGGYVWRWYKNTGGTLATEHTLTLSPVPLVANGGDSTLGHSTMNSGSAHGLYDITGDGFIDAISIDFDEHWKDARFPPDKDIVLNTNAWWVWPGDGKGGFGFESGATPIAWHVPFRASPSRGATGDFSWDAAGPHYWVSGTITVQDVNGDGLPDMLRQHEDSGEIRVHLNTGMGFRSNTTYLESDYPANTISWPYGNGVEYTSFAVTTDDNPSSETQPFAKEATRRSRLMIVDTDGDGLPDVYSKGTDVAESSPQKFYGANDAKLLLAKQSLNDIPRRLMDADLAEWKLRYDLIDFNGDGVPDQIYGGPNGIVGSYKFQTDDFQGKPMRLMNSVTNGRGLATEIRYAPNNAKSVAIDEDEIKGMPNHVWVVQTVSRSEELGAGASNSPDSVVEVKYGAPTWNADRRGHWGFRGFEAIETSAPHAAGESAGFAVTRQDYDFVLDYSGRLSGTTTFVDGFPAHDGSDLVASIATTGWTQRGVASVFASLEHDASISYVVDNQKSTICSDAQGFVSESVCLGLEASSETRTTHGYFPSSANSDPEVSSPVQTWTSSGGDYASDEQEGSLTQTTTMTLYSSDETYQLVPVETNSFVGDGSALIPTGRTVMTYSANGRDLDSQTVYHSEFDSEPAITSYTTDTSTGNSLSTTKPKQQVSGESATQTFSGFEVYPSEVYNEKNHRLRSFRDVATGQVTRTLAPNVMDCATGSSQYEGGETVYDGFGRPLEVYQYGCDTSGSYAPLLMQSFKYFEFDGTGPASVAVSTVLDESGTEAISQSYFDSYGRIIRMTSMNDAGESNIRYNYGVNGKIQNYNVPNPALDDDNKRSEYAYKYDTLGRQVGVRVPDSSGVAPDPGQPEWDSAVGVDTSYGFEDGDSTLTTIEIVQDGGSVGETKRYTNSLGQLVQVNERTGVSSVASTYYQYDGNGNMSNISDADGIETDMDHDWLGLRKAITRGGRKWEFDYDNNGNRVRETTPYPSGGIKMNYQSSYVYDVLDRPTTVVAAIRKLSPADQALFGSNLPVQYAYDSGANGIGRLNIVAGPHFTRSYDYDDLGRIASETFEYNLSGTTIGGAVVGSKTRTFSYTRAGSPSQLTTAAGLSLRYQHDSAGRENALIWENSGSGAVEIASLVRNAAGSVIEHATNTNVVRSWRYDQLGRVERTDVTRGKTLKLSEEMVYFDSNEVASMQVTREGLADRTFSFSYDSQHQLIAANDNIGEYDAQFKFSDSGLVETATIAAIPGAPQVIGREVSYTYGDHQAVDAHTVQTLNNSDGSSFAKYSHDLSGNVIFREDGQGIEFQYDGEDRQRRVQSSSGYSEVYFYDEKGQRFLAVEIDPAGSLERSRMWFGSSEFWTNHKGGNIRTMTNLTLGALAVARVDVDDSNNTSLEYSFHNGLGHLMGTVDESGTLTTAFVYGPFGEIIDESGAVDNHLRRFNGKEADQLSRLNYYGYRYYDPLSLQWTQADPLYRVAPDIAYDQPRHMGLYTFSLNNPMRYVDPDGREALTLGGALAIGAGAAVVTYALIRMRGGGNDEALQQALQSGQEAISRTLDSAEGIAKAIARPIAGQAMAQGMQILKARAAARAQGMQAEQVTTAPTDTTTGTPTADTPAPAPAKPAATKPKGQKPQTKKQRQRAARKKKLARRNTNEHRTTKNGKKSGKPKHQGGQNARNQTIKDKKRQGDSWTQR